MTAAGDLIAGRYRVRDPLAAGAMGHVWLGTDERTGRTVALKRCDLPKQLSPQERSLVRLWMPRESRAFARIRHPNVIRIFDVLLDGDASWIIMEYVPSRSLRDVIRERGTLPPGRVAAIGLDLLAALDAAAEADVLHLDVKPSNVLMADDGRVVLTDFGPVATRAGLAALAELKLVFGSPTYVAPERLAGGASDERCDLWSLGATLFHAVEGRAPFTRGSVGATLLAVGAGDADVPQQAGPLTPVLLGLLRRDPATRMPASEVRSRLRRIAAGRSTGPVRAATAVAVAVAAVAFGGLAVAARRPVTHDPATTLSAPATPAAPGNAPFAGGSPPQPAVPAGYARWSTPDGGLRLAVPRGWRCAPAADGLTCAAPGGQPVLGVTPWTVVGALVPALTAAESRIRLPGYRRLRIDTAATPPGAVWEYTFQDARAGTIRVIRQIVLLSGGHAYAVDWRAPAAGWAAALPALLTVLPTLTPGPGD